MRRLIQKGAGMTAAAILALSLTVAPVCSPKVWAAQTQLSSYTSKKTSDDSWYVHTFDNSRYFFLTSVAKGAITSQPVTVTVPSNCTLSGSDELLKSAQTARTSSGMSYTFAQAGTNSVTITAAEENGIRRYGKFYFTVLPSMDTEGSTNVIIPEKTKQGYRVVKHAGGGSYSSTVKDGDILYEPAVFLIGAGMSAEVTHKGNTSVYKSGEKLLDTGPYTMKFTSYNLNGKQETSSLSFTIQEIRFPETEDYGVSYPVELSKIVNPNLVDVGKPSVGEWTWETAIKSDQEDSVSDGKEKDNGSTVKVAGIKEISIKRVISPEVDKAEDTDSDKVSSRGATEEYVNSGPGITGAAETKEAEPETVLVELEENYHEEYKMYELSFANKYFFYSNVKNGAITSKSKPVTFDVPANITVKVERDGIPVDYNNKQAIAEPGTYVITLHVMDGMTIYQAIYHFRIEEKEPETESETESGSKTTGGAIGGATGGATGGLSFTVGSRENETAAVNGETPELSGTEEASEASEQNEASIGAIPGLDENSSMEDIDKMVEALTTPEITMDSREFSQETYTGLEESYDDTRRVFEEKLRSGTVFTSDIPNGMITNRSVKFDFPADLTVIVTKDDKPFEYTAGDPINQTGVYRMEFQETKVDYTINYDKPPFFTFRIVNGPVNDLEIYNAPEACILDSVMLGQEEIKVKDSRYARLDQDGDYHITVTVKDTNTQFTIKVTKDTVPVSFALKGVSGGVSTGTEVKLEYYSEDVERAELFRNGAKVESFKGSSITESGNYQIVVYDKAGNASSARFQMKYKMNIAGVVAILLVIGLGAAIFLFVRKVKRDVKVR